MAHTLKTRAKPVFATLAAIGRFLSKAHTSAGRSQDLRYMQNMSDAQLAKRGIKREDITRHVFGDLTYI
ncbi:MAG: DUF1127 domain-containing protein [Rhodobacteraceae bacterium]|nr:DUF1127 domain-containing protein [Paracoccaceae bacterium]